MKQTIDACGLSCPEPIIKLKKFIGSYDKIELLVDNATSAEACTRFSESKGYSVSVNKSGGVYTLNIQKGGKK